MSWRIICKIRCENFMLFLKNANENFLFKYWINCRLEKVSWLSK